MILVDSSAWIEYYRRGGEEEVRDLVYSAIRDHRAATNGIIKVEIVAYATREADSRNVWSDLSGCHWLDLTVPVFELAVEMGRKLRTRGVTVPATDLIIASSARRCGTAALRRSFRTDRGTPAPGHARPARTARGENTRLALRGEPPSAWVVPHAGVWQLTGPTPGDQ